MKKSITFLALSALLLAGCGGRTNNRVEFHGEVSADPPSVAAPVPAGDTLGYILLTVTGGPASATVEKRAAEPVVFAFESGGHQRLHATLSADDPAANIRFNQIFFPDGEADGPFGRQIDYELTRRGLYRLSVGENLMAGDPWAGRFTVTITLTD